MKEILQAIVDDDNSRLLELIKADHGLVTQQVERPKLYTAKIFHWLYIGDTALHLAAAGHRDEIAKSLLAAGADPRAAGNLRHGTPLHYAADGYLEGSDWNPEKQVNTIRALLAAGAEIDAPDKNGATPLHRAVRTRCAAAVTCLLDAGADPLRLNKPGSTVFHLAVQPTGRGGSGTEIAIAAQREIIETLLARGLSPSLKHANGKSVLDSARSGWVHELLVQLG